MATEEYTTRTASFRATKGNIRNIVGKNIEISNKSTLNGADINNDLNLNVGDLVMNPYGSIIFNSEGDIEVEEDSSGDYISDTFFRYYFDAQRTGKIYGTRIAKSKAMVSYEQQEEYDGVSGSSVPMGEPLADSIGLECLPYIEGIQAAKDDFTDTVPMFKKYRCNAYLDENGDIRVKYLQWQDGYKRTFNKGERAMDDCILKMSFYWKKEEGDSYYDYYVSDTKHDNTWMPISYAVRHDGTVAPYFALPAYMVSAHEDEDGFTRLYSLSDKKIQGSISHESQLPYYSQAISEKLIDDNTFSIGIGSNNSEVLNNTYRGRGRHYGTRTDLTAYIALMQIIKYRTRNLGITSAPSILNYNKNLVIPHYNSEGIATGDTSNITICPFEGKISYFQNVNRVALESYIENYPVYWVDYTKDTTSGEYSNPVWKNTNTSVYYLFDQSILPDDYDGSWFPAAPCFNFSFSDSSDVNEDGLKNKVLTTITGRCKYRAGNYVALGQQYVSNANATALSTPDFSNIDGHYTKDNKAQISKVESYFVDLEETLIPYAAFNVTMSDGSSKEIPAGNIVIPAGRYEFYKVYLKGYDILPCFDLNAYYSGSCTDESNTNFHATLKGRAVLNDMLCPAGATDNIPELYDGSALNTSENKGTFAYYRTYNILNNSYSYTYENILNRYNPYRIEGIELQNGYWLIPSNCILRGVSTKDSSGNIIEHKFEFWVSKPGASRHRLLTTSDNFTAFGDNTVDRTADLEKNYTKEGEIKYVNAAGNIYTSDWGWITDIDLVQSAPNKHLLLLQTMKQNGMTGGIADSGGENVSWGDHFWGNPGTGNANETKYSYRELLLCGYYSNGTYCGIAFCHASLGLASGYWYFSARAW